MKNTVKLCSAEEAIEFFNRSNRGGKNKVRKFRAGAGENDFSTKKPQHRKPKREWLDHI